MNTNQNIYKFPPLTDPDREFCYHPRRSWYNLLTQMLPKEGHDKPFTIALVRPSSLGDVLFLTPIVKAIKKKFLQASICVHTIHSEILNHNPNISSFGPHKRIDKADYTYFLSYEFTPNIHPVDAYGRIVGIEPENYEPEIHLTEHEILEGRDFLNNLKIKNKFIIIHDECVWRSRRWNNWQNFIDQHKKIYPDIDIVRVGTSKSQLNNIIDIGGMTPRIRLLASIIQHASYCVTIDSGIMHMAVALNRPVFSIFTIIDPNKRLPDRWLPLASQMSSISAGIHHRRDIPAETEPDLDKNINLVYELNVAVPYMEVINKIVQFNTNREANLFSILIPSYNKFHLNYRCIMSILKKTTTWNYEIIVADDCSNESTQDKLKTIDRLVYVNHYIKNLGFTKLCNNISQTAKGKYLVLLNNDTELLSTDWLKDIEENYNTDPKVGIIGAKLLYPNMTIQHAGIVWDKSPNKNAFHIYKNLPRNFIHANKYRYYRAITGACLIIKRDLWNQLGGFCEDYINSAEDTDLCFRTIELNKVIAYNPKIEFVHHEGATLGIAKTFDNKNLELLRSRWFNKYLQADFEHYMQIDNYESTHSERLKWFGELHPRFLVKELSTIAPCIPLYKIEIGSGMNPQPGYIHLDIMPHANHVDIVHDLTKPLPIGDNCVAELLANHVIEHISWRQIPFILEDWCRVLVKGGKLVLRTPSLEFIIDMYNKQKTTPESKVDEDHIIKYFGGSVSQAMYTVLKLFSGQDYPSNFHYTCYDYRTLTDLAKRVGFSVASKANLGREFSPGEHQLIFVK